MNRNGIILGLTGSLGSGKTFVASLLQQSGCLIICADALSKEAVQPGNPVLAKITQEFGNTVLLPDGSLDRPRLAKIVFANPAKRKLLEGLIHPYVRQREREIIAQNREHPLIVADIPLLYETGFDRECDKVAVVIVDENTRYERLARDRGLDRSQIEERLKVQMPQAEKAARADFTIDNSSDRENTKAQVRRMLRSLFPDGLPHPLQDSHLTQPANH